MKQQDQHTNSNEAAASTGTGQINFINNSSKIRHAKRTAAVKASFKQLDINADGFIPVEDLSGLLTALWSSVSITERRMKRLLAEAECSGKTLLSEQDVLVIVEVLVARIKQKKAKPIPGLEHAPQANKENDATPIALQTRPPLSLLKPREVHECAPTPEIPQSLEERTTPVQAEEVPPQVKRSPKLEPMAMLIAKINEDWQLPARTEAEMKAEESLLLPPPRSRRAAFSNPTPREDTQLLLPAGLQSLSVTELANAFTAQP